MIALKLLKILRDDYIHGELDEDINEAINELEEAMQPKTCAGCCWSEEDNCCDEICGKCLRNDELRDMYEPKEQ